MLSPKILSALASAAALGALAVAAPANADIIANFALTSDHCTNTCLPGGISAGTVTVTDNGSGTLHYLVDLAAGFGFINTGIGGTFGFGLDKSPITVSNIQPNPSGPTFALQSTTAGAIQIDGFGNFKYAFDCTAGCGTGGNNPFFGDLSFDVTATGGLSLSPGPTGDVTMSTIPPGSQTTFFAVDVFSTVGGGGNGATGAVDAGSPVITTTNPPLVPEPGTLAVLGSALAAFGIFRRRRRSA
jgi:hypothetical protein